MKISVEKYDKVRKQIFEKVLKSICQQVAKINLIAIQGGIIKRKLS
jgi:hypothetical protein